jgi:hypothetical protein
MLYIYVLQLQNDKYYVGKTSNPHFRFDNHFKHNGTEWTKIYKPLKILELIQNCDNYDEDKYTYKYMDKYGIDNVRGGSYSSVVLDNETIKQLKKISNSINNRCYICGKADGHFAKECSDNVNILTASQFAQKHAYIPLQTLLTESPNKMRRDIKDIGIIRQLKVFRIKLGDSIAMGYSIILNYNKAEYYSLHELVEDATNIFNKCEHTEHSEIVKIPGVNSLEHAKILHCFLLPCKINFYQNIAGLLELLSVDRCKLLQSGSSFNEIEYSIIQQSSH